MNSKRVTIADLAEASGYSKTAVSFAYNDPSRISRKAYERIKLTAEKIGYVPSPMARTLSLQKYQSIGILLPHQLDDALKNPYIIHLIQGVGAACAKDSYTVTMIPPVNESLSEAVRTAAVDGLIAVGLHAEMRAVEIMKQRRIPFVSIDGIASDTVPGVNSSDEQAAYELMHLVLSKGHRRLAVISMDLGSHGELPRSIVGMRLKGFQRALVEFGLSPEDPSLRWYEQPSTFAGGQDSASVMLNEQLLPTCVVCMSDIIAIGCLNTLSEHGVKVPEDVSVTGYDDIEMASAVTPRLTTVRQPGREKGYAAASMLISMIEGQEASGSQVSIPYRIIERGSLCRLEH